MREECRIDGCDKPRRTNCRYCQRHYRLLNLHGTIFCTEPDCNSPITYQDKCDLHKPKRRGTLTSTKPRREHPTDPDYIRITVKYSDDVIRQRGALLNKT